MLQIMRCQAINSGNGRMQPFLPSNALKLLDACPHPRHSVPGVFRKHMRCRPRSWVIIHSASGEKVEVPKELWIDVRRERADALYTSVAERCVLRVQERREIMEETSARGQALSFKVDVRRGPVMLLPPQCRCECSRTEDLDPHMPLIDEMTIIPMWPTPI